MAGLIGIVAAMARGIDEGTTADYSGLNRRFHRRLREIAPHAVSRLLVEALRIIAVHHQHRLLGVPGRADESLEQKSAVAQAVIGGRSEAPDAAMRDHLASVASVLRPWNQLGVSV